MDSSGNVVGYATDYVLSIARIMGYNLEIKECAFSGLIPALEADYADIAGRTMQVTEERAKVVDFSSSFLTSDLLLLVRKDSVSPSLLTESDETSDSKGISEFITNTIAVFKSTFITENRWRLFLSGIGTTLLITLVSGIGGTILGLMYYLLLRRKDKVINPLLTTINRWILGTPVVVFLMVLYYIVFSGTGLDAIWIAIICFGIIFTISVASLIENGVRAVGMTQLEGALALGFTDRQAFVKVILPQAAYQALPLYRAKLIEHLKGTAIVGYVAIQDLTKMSDLIRSRTFNAFFPLISTAVIYLILGFVINKLLLLLERNIDPDRRAGHKLKGVNVK